MQIYRMKKSNDGQQFDMTNFIHCFYAVFDCGLNLCNLLFAQSMIRFPSRSMRFKASEFNNVGSIFSLPSTQNGHCLTQLSLLRITGFPFRRIWIQNETGFNRKRKNILINLKMVESFK